jgi:monoamine oxidase
MVDSTRWRRSPSGAVAVEVQTRDWSGFAACAVVVAVRLNALGVMIGFGPDAGQSDNHDLAAVQNHLDAILSGYEVIDATAHDWLGDEFSRGTWAIRRPGWYEHHHAAMQRPEDAVVFAGSDIANGWSGFIDGAIESGLRGASLAAALA